MRRGFMVGVLFLFALLVAADRTALAGYRIIHEFDGTDGSAPYGHLISAGGMLYGMTAGDNIDNMGMIFSLAPDGSGFTLLHHFAGQPGDGAWPHGSLFYQGGTLYGITWAGGCSQTNCLNKDGNGCGTLLSLQTNGSNYKEFWEFSCGGADLYAALPNAHFVSDGAQLYSTASVGGASDMERCLPSDRTEPVCLSCTVSAGAMGRSPRAAWPWRTAFFTAPLPGAAIIIVARCFRFRLTDRTSRPCSVSALWTEELLRHTDHGQ